MPSGESPLEPLIHEIGERLYRDAAKSPPALFGVGGVRGALLEHALADERLRNALFQFIDVLPQLETADSIARHFRSYLDTHPLKGPWGRLLRIGNHPAAAWAVRASVVRTARLFLVEENEAAVKRVLSEIGKMGAAVTIDAVGEAVLTEREADLYAARYVDVLRWQAAAGAKPPHISIKLTALTPRFDPLDPEGTERRVLKRIAPLLAEVTASAAALTIDMEHHELKPLILRVFRAVADAYPDRSWRPGIAVQAYLPETERDVADLVAWARRSGRRIGIRLVKGAYWDTEVALARQRRWPIPVYLSKADTDANYERLTRLLFEACDAVYPEIAGHNLRSLSHAIALAERLRVAPAQWEIQMLYGMAQPLAHAVASLGLPLRIYVPTGDLVIGIAYLIRRLLENTAGTSVLRHTYAEGDAPDVLLAAPVSTASTMPPPAQGFVNTPHSDFSQHEVREAFRHALSQVRAGVGRLYRLAVSGAAAAPARRHASVNPARPDEILGHIELATTAHAGHALERATAAFPAWRATPAAKRAELAEHAARIMSERRFELAAWQVLEQGKNWREADADVAEAIDHLRYNAAEAVRLDGWRETQHFPGESNLTRFEPCGVAVVISPWNFPLAILAGMTSAALVTGNCAIMKPAAPALIVAHRFHEILLEAGFPAEVCQLLPGSGAEIGDYLVSHRDVDIIAFTGSREVGLRIQALAAQVAQGQTHLKRVVCEMGGKNAIIVDEDADLDEAVVQIVHSAFGYQGQKCSACSRLVAVGRVHDRLVARLAAALEAYSVGPPEDPQHVFGPVITGEAQEKVLRYIEIGKTEGRLYFQGRVPEVGFYVPPTLFTDIEPHHRLAREEIFGPVLSVLRSSTFEDALEMALDSDYALTGGVFSRLPEHLALAKERYRVGNLYLNRRITGALVGVQPFGGVKLSGSGVQAGGTEYLKQFLWSRVVSENTMRHGFVP